MSNQRDNLQLAVLVGGGYLLYKAFTGITAGVDDLTKGGGALTSTIGRDMQNEWLAAARLQYAELMRRPFLPLNDGRAPASARLLTDNECFEIANIIAERLEGLKSDYPTIQKLFSNLRVSASDLRMIYAAFGSRRITTLSGKTNLFSWYRRKLTSNELKQARLYWRPANIVPPL